MLPGPPVSDEPYARTGSLALVDETLKVLRALTLKEARALVREHPPGPRGYGGFAPEAGWCLWGKGCLRENGSASPL